MLAHAIVILFAHLYAFVFPEVALAATSPGVLTKRDDNLPARVPYVFPPPGTDSVADALRARRTNGTLLDLDGVLLNAELIASGWNSLFSVIRDNNSIPADLRELLILRSAVLNGASYQWIQHEPEGRAAGLTTQQLLEIRSLPPFLGPATQNTSLTPEQASALLFADHITKDVKVPTNVFNALKQFMSDKQMVETVATVGGYSFVSRFVVALNVDDKMDFPVPFPQ